MEPGEAAVAAAAAVASAIEAATAAAVATKEGECQSHAAPAQDEPAARNSRLCLRLSCACLSV